MCLHHSVTVSEDVGQISLTVRRDQGTVGRVSAVVLLTDQGATAEEDYIRTNYEVTKSLTLLTPSCVHVLYLVVYIGRCVHTGAMTFAFMYTHPQRIVFTSGDSEEVVLVSIVDDEEPELSETFCISLILPDGNVVIGDTPEGMHLVY